MSIITTTVVIVQESCCHCGAVFGLAEHFMKARRTDGADFFCPNGHCLVYKNGPLERAKRELQHERRWRDQAEADARELRKSKRAVQRSLAATRGVVTRTKRRIAAGVCPCCKRSFQNLRRHMSCKHPEYGKTDASGG